VSGDVGDRPAWSAEKARAYIREQAGKYFDPEIVEKFLALAASWDQDARAPAARRRGDTTKTKSAAGLGDRPAPAGLALGMRGRRRQPASRRSGG
jgi:hypothetical protein